MENMIKTSKGNHIPIANISYIDEKDKYIVFHMNTGEQITIDISSIDETSQQILDKFHAYHNSGKQLLTG